MAEELEQEKTAESPPAEEPKGAAESAESAPASGDAPPQEPPRKKGGGFQKRIDKLTRTVYELQAQLEAAKADKPAAKNDQEPKRDDFEDLESYQRALAEHVSRRVVREHQTREEETRRQAQARDAQSRRVQAWESHVEKAADKYDDGEDVIGHFVENVRLNPYAFDAILESESGADIAYYLGKHEDEAVRISKLTPGRQAIEIGKLEAKLAAGARKASAAPAPIEPVGGKGGADTGLSDNLSTGEWIRRRQKQVHGR